MAGRPTGTGSTEAEEPGPGPPGSGGIVEDQVNRSVTVQQVSADTEVRGSVLREDGSKIRTHSRGSQEEGEGSVQIAVMNGPTRGGAQELSSHPDCVVGRAAGIRCQARLLVCHSIGRD